MDNNNPFYYNLPVQPAGFMDRWPLVEQIVADLGHPQADSWAVIGGRRFGKSSVLKALEFRLQAQLLKCQAGERHIVPFTIDLKRCATQSEQQIYACILLRLHAALLNNPALTLDLSLTRWPTLARDEIESLSFLGFEKALQELAGVFEADYGPLRLILLLDEVESMTNFAWSETLFNQLRALIYDGPLADIIKLVLTGSAQVIRVRQAGSPLLNAVKIVHLATFSEAGLNALLALGGQIPAEVASAVRSQSGGHPFVAQYLLHHAWLAGLEQCTGPQIEQLARHMQQERAADLRGWWDAVGKAGQQVYRVLAQRDEWVTQGDLLAQVGTVTPAADQGLSALSYHGLIIHDKERRRYRLGGSLFGAWFQDVVVHEQGEAGAWEQEKKADMPKIRTLLTEGFTVDELYNKLCYDEEEFKPVYEQLTEGMSKADIINKIVVYADQKEKVETLLAWAKKYNLSKYQRYYPYYQ